MNEKSEFLGTEKINKLLWQLATPAIIGLLVQAFYNLVDTFFVGRALGDQSVLGIAGVAVAFPLQMLMMAISIGIGVGGSSVISRMLGSGDVSKAERTLGNVFTYTLVLSIIFEILFFLNVDTVLNLFGATVDNLPYAKEYAVVILQGTLAFTFGFVLNNLVRAEGNSKIAMNNMVFSGVLNIFLDAILMFGFDMGVKGAALATVLSQLIGTLYLLHYYVTGKSPLRLEFSAFTPKFDLIKEITLIGFGSFVMGASNSLMMLVLNNVLEIYGGDLSIAVFGVAGKLMMLVFMPIIGISHGLQPILGYNYGAENYERVNESLRLSLKITTLFGVAGLIVLSIFPGTFFSLFSTDAELINSGASALRIIMLASPLIGLNVIGTTLFQSVGKARPSFVLSLCRQILFLIPMVLFLPHYFDLIGVWMAFPISDLMAAFLSMFLVWKEYRYFQHRSSNA
ncbi:MATE family efflux transporter [Methanolobus vulcani]|jgi:putative MATE family efflux protein|uniref:Multidrug export protein MepA n=1 Tax=Methanolobus vulcani TaxID=38026 RepID=A0A7Z8P4J4_9EURY|nr:MATE family efflux transporter [Methanolobus vulcani]TQD24963.1 MATE family efflux transporter [Methanolobus vulcani]